MNLKVYLDEIIKKSKVILTLGDVIEQHIQKYNNDKYDVQIILYRSSCKTQTYYYLLIRDAFILKMKILINYLN